jgi:hypothetical protein
MMMHSTKNDTAWTDDAIPKEKNANLLVELKLESIYAQASAVLVTKLLVAEIMILLVNKNELLGLVLLHQ